MASPSTGRAPAARRSPMTAAILRAIMPESASWLSSTTVGIFSSRDWTSVGVASPYRLAVLSSWGRVAAVVETTVMSPRDVIVYIRPARNETAVRLIALVRTPV